MTAPPFPDPDDRLELEPGCDRCPEPAAAREEIAWGHGPDDAEVFVVGEAPGSGDPDAERWRGGNWTGLAFTTRHSGRRSAERSEADLVGRAKRVQRWIRRLFDRADLLDATFFTNAVKCLPPDGDGGARGPTDEERGVCRGHLERELEIVAPSVVVPAGKHATASVFGLAGRELDGFLDAVLAVHHLDGLPPVVPVLHPSYRDVWAARLGYDDGEAYERAVAERLDWVLASA